jgi:hypothetical protein
MPTRELEPFVAMRPRIEARRAVAAAEQIAVGTGRLKEADHSATLARWREAIAAGASVTRPDAPTLATAARSAGIGFRTVSR